LKNLQKLNPLLKNFSETMFQYLMLEKQSKFAVVLRIFNFFLIELFVQEETKFINYFLGIKNVVPALIPWPAAIVQPQTVP
jgi:hypothetical protein